MTNANLFAQHRPHNLGLAVVRNAADGICPNYHDYFGSWFRPSAHACENLSVTPKFRPDSGAAGSGSGLNVSSGLKARQASTRRQYGGVSIVGLQRAPSAVRARAGGLSSRDTATACVFAAPVVSPSTNNRRHLSSGCASPRRCSVIHRHAPGVEIHPFAVHIDGGYTVTAGTTGQNLKDGPNFGLGLTWFSHVGAAGGH